MIQQNVTLKSFAKINLSLDVVGLLPQGYHEVEMILQQIDLYDDVTVRLVPGEKGTEISTNRRYLPRDHRNIAYQGAELMRGISGITDKIRIDIKKRIPVSAGLGGGSGNGAAVLLALNYILEMNLSLDQLIEQGEKLGSDVPFSLIGQAASHDFLAKKIREDSMAGVCALAQGRGTRLTPIKGIKAYVVLAKPPISCSTKEIYQSYDKEIVSERPNTLELLEGIDNGDWKKININMINVLENVTLKRYPIVKYTKEIMESVGGSQGIIMSGSGPTVYGLYSEKENAYRCYEKMKGEFRETFLTQTSIALGGKKEKEQGND